MRGKISTILIILLLAGIAIAQKEEAKPVLQDRLIEPNCEHLLAVLDALASKVHKNPGSKGYVVIYCGSDVIENAIYKRLIENHKLFRNFDKNRFLTITSKGVKNLKIETLFSISGEKPKIENEKFSLKFSNLSKPILFSNDLLQLVKIEGKLTYIDYGCEGCCMHYFDPYLLSNLLQANPELNVKIKIFSKSKNLAKKAKQILIKKDIKIANLPMDRMIFEIIDKPNLQQKEQISPNCLEENSNEKFVCLDVQLIPIKRDKTVIQ